MITTTNDLYFNNPELVWHLQNVIQRHPELGVDAAKAIYDSDMIDTMSLMLLCVGQLPFNRECPLIVTGWVEPNPESGFNSFRFTEKAAEFMRQTEAGSLIDVRVHFNPMYPFSANPDNFATLSGALWNMLQVDKEVEDIWNNLLLANACVMSGDYQPNELFAFSGEFVDKIRQKFRTDLDDVGDILVLIVNGVKANLTEHEIVQLGKAHWYIHSVWNPNTGSYMLTVEEQLHRLLKLYWMS